MSSSTEQLAIGVELREEGSLLLAQRPGNFGAGNFFTVLMASVSE
jgi:hypothetical protein